MFGVKKKGGVCLNAINRAEFVSFILGRYLKSNLTVTSIEFFLFCNEILTNKKKV